MLTTGKTKYLGKILVDKKVVTQEELQEALLAQENTRLRLGQMLMKKGLATEEEILQALSIQYDIEYRAHIDFADPEELFVSIPPQFLKKNNIVPFQLENKKIFVAITDVLNIYPFDDLKIMFPDYQFIPVITTSSEVQRIINNYFDVFKEDSTDNVIENLEESEFEILSSPISETEDILDMANEAPIIRLVNMMIKQAINDRASDIHIEPYEKDMIVRFRVDGILYNMYSPPKKFQGAVISRIKIMANLNIAENRLPQDGRIQLKVGGKDIDIRVSVFPTFFGERIVLRILNKSDMEFDLDALGFSKKDLVTFNSIISKTHGIILATGPTGSGKTTTLYSVLQRLNTTDVNILTDEDPIEYQLHGISQMQVKPKIDLTFANGLRSILRQDPDIIMVGEIRDLETAEIAVQSALTGHMVFSTLHTNDAAGALTLLVEMGVEPFLAASSIVGILAQRLVRTICPHCKEAVTPPTELLEQLGDEGELPADARFYRGRGCSRCMDIGYWGRKGIYELLPVDETVRGL